MTESRILNLLENEIDVKINGQRIVQIEIPSGYVPISFMPLIDKHFVKTGDRLRDGMIVLLADTGFRDNPERLSPEYPSRARGFRPSDYDRQRVQETARWALVTDYRLDGSVVSFTAVYADGTMATRGGYNKSIKWIIQKEFRMITEDQLGDVCEECGEKHPEVSESDDMETMTGEVTSQLLGETLTFSQFLDRFRNDPTFVPTLFGNLFDKLVGVDVSEESTEEVSTDRPRRPDESDEEYADRLRDEDEACGDYDRSEFPRIKRSRS